MNGLKCIRTRCNFSLNFLSNKLGVSRQIISDWELNKRDIPELRKKQLSKLFGLPEEFFGEIDDNKVAEISKMPLYRFFEEDHELYRYNDDDSDKTSSPIIYSKQTLLNPDITLDKHFSIAKQRKKEELNRIDNVFMYDNNIVNIADYLVSINRGIALYSKINDIMECMPKQQNEYRMQFYLVLLNVIKSISLGLNVDDKCEYTNADSEETKILNKISEYVSDIYKERIRKIDIKTV